MKKEHKIIALIIVGLLIWILGPHLLYLIDTSMNDNTSIDYAVESQKTNLVNQYRVTVTQAFVGIAVLYGVYQGWQRITIAEDNLKVSQEGQITERFTRAVDQFGAYDHVGKPALEIRLGGIYALERIANESDKYYWPIMEILTAYVRKNSNVDDHLSEKALIIEPISIESQSNESTQHEIKKYKKISLDIDAVLNVLGKHEHVDKNGDYMGLYLRGIYLKSITLTSAHLEGANFADACFENATLLNIHFEKAFLAGTNFKGAALINAHFKGSYLSEANLTNADLSNADLSEAIFEKATLIGTNLAGADLEGTNLTGANLEYAELRKTHNLSIDQLSKVKTLYRAELDEELEIPLREKYPALFDKPDE